MLDLSTFDQPHDFFDAEINGESVSFGWRKPDPYEMIDFRKDSMGLVRKMSELQERAEDEDAAFEADISSEDYMPVLRFLVNKIVACKGLGNSGEPLEWTDLDDGTRIRLLRRLGPMEAFEFLGCVSESVELEVEVKND